MATVDLIIKKTIVGGIKKSWSQFYRHYFHTMPSNHKPCAAVSNVKYFSRHMTFFPHEHHEAV